MAKKHFFGKLVAFTATAAAVGGACYVFRDKIKENPTCKAALDKLNALRCKLNETKDDDACEFDEFGFDDEDEDFDSAFSDDNKSGREYTSITINAKDEATDEDAAPASDKDAKTTEDEATTTNKNAETDEDEATDEDAKTSEEEDTSIPVINFASETSTASESQSEPTGYENEGLSDVSEDPDVLEEQDRLDF